MNRYEHLTQQSRVAVKLEIGIEVDVRVGIQTKIRVTVEHDFPKIDTQLHFIFLSKLFQSKFSLTKRHKLRIEMNFMILDSVELRNF